MSDTWQDQRHCARCGRHTLHQCVVADAPNHILHFLITVFSCGLWVFPWALFTISHQFARWGSSYHCQQCGQVN